MQSVQNFLPMRMIYPNFHRVTHRGVENVGFQFSFLLQVILYVWRMVSNQKKNKEKHMFHTCSRLAILQTTSTHRYLRNKSCVFFLHKIHFHHHPLAQKKTMPLPSKQNPSIFTKLFINFLCVFPFDQHPPKISGQITVIPLKSSELQPFRGGDSLPLNHHLG